MRKFFKSVAAAGAGIALLGVIMCVVSGVFFGEKVEIPNGKWGFLRIGDSFSTSVHSDDVQINPKGETIKRNNVQSLEVEIKGGTLKIAENDTANSVSLILEEGFNAQNLKQKYNSENNKWEIELDSKAKKHFEDYSATLILPKAMMKELEVDMNMGTLELDAASAEKMSFNANMANITLGGISAKALKVDAKMSNITGTVVFTRNVEVDSSMSAVSLLVFGMGDYGYKVKNKMGSVTIGDYTHDGFGGETEVNMVSSLQFDVENAMGDVNIELGQITDNYNGGGNR